MLVAGALLLTSVVGIFEQHARGQTRSATVSPADYLRWRTELRNWGRWGPNDQKGTANLITASKVLDAARLVKAGIVVSMAHAVQQKVAADVSEPRVFHRTTNSIGATATTDTYQVSYHGLALPHTDAFCHFFFEGRMYNGYSVNDSITPETGCTQGDIGIVTRAVLYDMRRDAHPAHGGDPRLRVVIVVRPDGEAVWAFLRQRL